MSIDLHTLDAYNEDNILYYFQQLSSIPRKSGHEQAVSNYIKEFAHELGLWVHQDEHYNLIIKKSGTEGYEDHEPLIIQGHMDMVCTKLEDVDHDFINDSITLIAEHGILHANGTTLGADDGFAVAYGMALLASSNIPHPPLEVVFTVEEETTFKGAKTLDYSQLTSKKIINLDGDRVNHVTIGSAGGHAYTVTVPMESISINNEMTKRRITVDNLIGGHSGCDIHLGRGNGIYILSHVLERIQSIHDVRVVSIHGGSAPNAIPLRAYADVYIHLQDVPYVQVLLQEEQDNWNQVHEKAKEAMRIQLSVVPTINRDDLVELDLESITLERGISRQTMERVYTIIHDIPQGVLEHHPSNPNEVWYSNNIGIIETGEKGIVIKMQARSTKPENLEHHYKCVKALVEGNSCTVEKNSPYPGWNPQYGSPMQKLITSVYNDVTHKDDLEFLVTHGGLEVGYMIDNMDGTVDALNMGPTIYDLHAPTERMELDTYVTTWKILKEFLKRS